MPLFMDVHNVDGGVSAADVAGAHEADLATQGAYTVNYLRYWVDEEAALRAELGVAPGPAVQAAMRQPGRAPGEVAGDATIEAIIEAGSAAVSAGAVEAGVQSLRTAARLADGAGATRLRVSSRLVLAEALIHALGGLDEEGLATLHEADEIALADGLHDAVAQARAELDAQCDLGRRHGHPETGAWVETLRNLASRSGMRELTLRSLQHGAVLGRAGDGAAAAVLADELAECR